MPVTPDTVAALGGGSRTATFTLIWRTSFAGSLLNIVTGRLLKVSRATRAGRPEDPGHRAC
jgi:hypothetical protein